MRVALALTMVLSGIFIVLAAGGHNVSFQAAELPIAILGAGAALGLGMSLQAPTLGSAKIEVPT